MWRGEGLLREVIEDKIERERPWGRRIMGMLEESYEKESYDIVKKRAEDQELCKNVGWPEPVRRQNTKGRLHISVLTL